MSNTTERDELADLFGRIAFADTPEERDSAEAAIRAMLPRQVTTIRELHALPTDTVIRNLFGAVFVKDGGWWAETGARDKSLSADLDLPATVLHEGGKA